MIYAVIVALHYCHSTIIWSGEMKNEAKLNQLELGTVILGGHHIQNLKDNDPIFYMGSSFI